jgi:N-ethylmaleimide reductase
MNENMLFSPYKLGSIELKNRIVMAPMTRSRATGNIPNDLMATYYEQRSDAGLIVTEGTSPSPNGLGYCRIPGIFSTAQVEGWKKITKAVHAKGGHIFLQIMHTGRISHAMNLPQGAVVLAPSAVKAAGQIWTDASGLQNYPTPKMMTPKEIELTKKEYITAAGNVIAAGFDGLELHGANGYLLEQFLSPYSNQRTDSYGGSIESRCRFVLEVVDGVCAEIGKEKIGIRLSPYGIASDMRHYPEIDTAYTYLSGELNKRGIAYIHVVDHSAMGAPEVPSSIKKAIREKFHKTLILAGGYNKERAEEDLQSGLAHLIAFGKPFINNPDLVKRLVNDLPITKDLDMKTFYSPGEKGYTDYPTYRA